MDGELVWNVPYRLEWLNVIYKSVPWPKASPHVGDGFYHLLVMFVVYSITYFSLPVFYACVDANGQQAHIWFFTLKENLAYSTLEMEA